MSELHVKNSAEYVVSWANEFVYVCRRHLAQLKEISIIMGYGELSYTACTGNHVCKNCEDEERVAKE